MKGVYFPRSKPVNKCTRISYNGIDEVIEAIATLRKSIVASIWPRKIRTRVYLRMSPVYGSYMPEVNFVLAHTLKMLEHTSQSTDLRAKYRLSRLQMTADEILPVRGVSHMTSWASGISAKTRKARRKFVDSFAP